MDSDALRILKRVSGSGEMTLAQVIGLAKPRYRNHLDQYPLALLIEDGYIGMTINHEPPTGAEKMREFTLATTLHMFTLPRNSSGIVHYHGVNSSGNLNPEMEAVFLKTKGALYLSEYRQKLRDRLWSFFLGFFGGILATIASAWLKGQMRLP